MENMGNLIGYKYQGVMIIVTGGAGFIGSCIVARLNALGRQDLLVVDHLTEIKKNNLQGKRFEQYLDKQEFLDTIEKDRLTSKVNGIIHMGACSSTLINDVAYLMKNNFEYSCAVARWALKHEVRLIYASSAATYGDGSLGYRDDEETTRRLKPLNLYGESKHKFDLWVLDHSLKDKVVGLKFFNVFGPNEYHKGEMRSVMAKAYDRLLKTGHMSLFKSYCPQYADGQQKRDFIYVKDAVDIVMHFWEHPEINDLYNVGTGRARSWNDVALALFAAVGKKPQIDYIEMPESLRDVYQYFTQADMTKLKEAGYSKPFTSLEEAVRDYAGYLKGHAYI